MHHVNTNQKKAEVAMFLSVKIDVRARKITRYKEGQYLMMRGQEDITILNVYACNKRAVKYMKQKEIKQKEKNLQFFLQVSVFLF